MSNITRLKFAYARGARIQVPEGAVKWLGDPTQGPWVTVNMPFWSPAQVFRIHPDDAHLEYGPLSSLVRELAIYGWEQADRGPYEGVFKVVAQNLWSQFQSQFFDSRGNDGTEELMQFQMLFFAELLADEGL